MKSKYLEQAKQFADLNFCMSEYRQIYVETEDMNVTDPWIDRSARFRLTDEAAVKEWGLDVIVEFCMKVNKVLGYNPHEMELMKQILEKQRKERSDARGNKVKELADRIIKEGTKNTSNGSWCVYWDELPDGSTDAMDDLHDELLEREEVAEVEVNDECIDVMLWLGYCPNAEEE